VKFLFYPHLPSEKNALIYKICTIKGWEMVNDPYAPFDLAINWEDITYRNQDETLLSLKQKTFVINGECIDISKQYIDAVHHKVFGYGLGVDPTVFEGEVAQKSDRNGTHNGRVVQCPISAEERDAAVAEGYIFTRMIHTATALPGFSDPSYARDIRVPFMRNEIPFCYFGYRSMDKLFGFSKVFVELAETTDVFSDEEIRNIHTFCQAIGLDYGELDILRDTNDGKIYIVDANNTPSGPQQPLPEEWRLEALKRLSDSFERNYIEEK
jgi:hypothetical protein